MAVDLQRSVKTLLFPLLLLAVVYLWQQPLAARLADLDAIAIRLPYALFITGLVLALLFHYSREFFSIVILLLCCVILDYLVWPDASHTPSNEIYFLLTLLGPINLLINDLWRERGVFNRHGLLRLLLIIAQLGLVFWLVYAAAGPLAAISRLAPWETWLSSPISPLAQLTILLCGIALLIYVFTHPSTLQAALFVAFVALVSALHYVEHPFISRLYLIFAGLLILVALLLNLRQLAYYDELTQLPSRRALRQTLMSLGNRYSLAMVDVDHFKKLNDTHGHDVGDQVLRMLATRLRKVKAGKAFRYGGEEFTLVFPGKLTDEIQEALEELRSSIAESPFKVRHKRTRPAKRPDKPRPRKDAPTLKVSVSIGVADTMSAGEPQAIMKCADQALYNAKKKGRNRVVTAG